ncbi:ribonuclease H-like domain-containing protein [Tanacetum coccineum]
MFWSPLIPSKLLFLFTRDNNCAVEFDAFGLSVKDVLTRHILVRCDSSIDIYPVASPSSTPHALLSVSLSTWHQCLRHPGEDVLRSLMSRQFISCNKEKSSHLYHACQLGKYVRRPFASSESVITRSFKIVHFDISTSPIVRFATTHTIPNPSTRTHPMVTRAQVGTVKPNPYFHGHTYPISPIPKSPSVTKTTWLRNLLRELHTPLLSATLVYCENVSAIYMTANPVQHQRTKHIEIDIHFVCDIVARGQVRGLHVPSRYQYANIFTKGLLSVLFREFHTSLSVQPCLAQNAGECLIVVCISLWAYHNSLPTC